VSREVVLAKGGAGQQGAGRGTVPGEGQQEGCAQSWRDIGNRGSGEIRPQTPWFCKWCCSASSGIPEAEGEQGNYWACQLTLLDRGVVVGEEF
jgi:hypothetical protein